MGRAMLSKSLIQFSVDGQGCVLPLLFDLRPKYVGGNEDNGNLLQKGPCMHYCTQCPQSRSMSPPTHTSARDSYTVMGRSGSVSCGVTAPFFWVLVCTRFFVPSKSLFLQSCVSSSGSMVGLMVTSSKRAYAIPRSTAPRAPTPGESTAGLYLHRRLKHSSVLVSVGSLGPGAHKVWLGLGLERLWCVRGLILNSILPFLPSCWGSSFALGCGVCPQSRYSAA